MDRRRLLASSIQFAAAAAAVGKSKNESFPENLLFDQFPDGQQSSIINILESQGIFHIANSFHIPPAIRLEFYSSGRFVRVTAIGMQILDHLASFGSEEKPIQSDVAKALRIDNRSFHHHLKPLALLGLVVRLPVAHQHTFTYSLQLTCFMDLHQDQSTDNLHQSITDVVSKEPMTKDQIFSSLHLQGISRRDLNRSLNWLVSHGNIRPLESEDGNARTTLFEFVAPITSGFSSSNLSDVKTEVDAEDMDEDAMAEGSTERGLLLRRFASLEASIHQWIDAQGSVGCTLTEMMRHFALDRKFATRIMDRLVVAAKQKKQKFSGIENAQVISLLESEGKQTQRRLFTQNGQQRQSLVELTGLQHQLCFDASSIAKTLPETGSLVNSFGIPNAHEIPINRLQRMQALLEILERDSFREINKSLAMHIQLHLKETEYEMDIKTLRRIIQQLEECSLVRTMNVELSIDADLSQTKQLVLKPNLPDNDPSLESFISQLHSVSQSRESFFGPDVKLNAGKQTSRNKIDFIYGILQRAKQLYLYLLEQCRHSANANERSIGSIDIPSDLFQRLSLSIFLQVVGLTRASDRLYNFAIQSPGSTALMDMPPDIYRELQISSSARHRSAIRSMMSILHSLHLVVPDERTPKVLHGLHCTWTLSLPETYLSSWSTFEELVAEANRFWTDLECNPSIITNDHLLLELAQQRPSWLYSSPYSRQYQMDVRAAARSLFLSQHTKRPLLSSRQSVYRDRSVLEDAGTLADEEMLDADAAAIAEDHDLDLIHVKRDLTRRLFELQQRQSKRSFEPSKDVDDEDDDEQVEDEQDDEADEGQRGGSVYLTRRVKRERQTTSNSINDIGCQHDMILAIILLHSPMYSSSLGGIQWTLVDALCQSDLVTWTGADLRFIWKQMRKPFSKMNSMYLEILQQYFLILAEAIHDNHVVLSDAASFHETYSRILAMSRSLDLGVVSPNDDISRLVPIQDVIKDHCLVPLIDITSLVNVHTRFRHRELFFAQPNLVSVTSRFLEMPTIIDVEAWQLIKRVLAFPSLQNDSSNIRSLYVLLEGSLGLDRISSTIQEMLRLKLLVPNHSSSSGNQMFRTMIPGSEWSVNEVFAHLVRDRREWHQSSSIEDAVEAGVERSVLLRGSTPTAWICAMVQDRLDLHLKHPLDPVTDVTIRRNGIWKERLFRLPSLLASNPSDPLGMWHHPLQSTMVDSDVAMNCAVWILEILIKEPDLDRHQISFKVFPQLSSFETDQMLASLQSLQLIDHHPSVDGYHVTSSF